MTERKFTPPTEFPAEYVTSDGRKAVILGTMPCKNYPFVGYIVSWGDRSWDDRYSAVTWTGDGCIVLDENRRGDLWNLSLSS